MGMNLAGFWEVTDSLEVRGFLFAPPPDVRSRHARQQEAERHPPEWHVEKPAQDAAHQRRRQHQEQHTCERNRCPQTRVDEKSAEAVGAERGNRIEDANEVWCDIGLSRGPVAVGAIL